MASEEITYPSSSEAMTGKPTSPTRKWKSMHQENVLDKYASYTALFTLSTLSREQIANPRLITTSKPKDVIAKSAGIGSQGNYSPFNRQGTTFDRSAVAAGYGDRTMDTVSQGAINSLEKSSQVLQRGHDIFFKKVTINSVNAANEVRRMQTVNKIDFQLQEPLGVTLFERLRAAAFNNGYRLYTDMPSLLSIEFRGFDDRGNPVEVATARYIPIKIQNVTMSIDASGTNYDVLAMPYNEYALVDKYLYTRGTGGIYQKENKPGEITSVDRKAETLNGALGILADNLNEQQVIEVKYGLRENEATVDKYVIDTDPEVFQYTELGGNNDTDSAGVTGNGLYKFSIRPNQGITQIIEDIVLQTEGYRNIGKIVEKYWKAVASAQELEGQITQEELIEKMPDFMVPWFKIKSSIYNTEAFDRITKQHAKVIHYRVLPYYIHILNFAVPGLSGSPSWTRQAIKHYKYIYTGENNQILDLKIDYNYSFSQARLLDGSRSDAASARDVKNLGLIQFAYKYGNRSLDYPEPNLPMPSHPSAQKREDVSTEDRGSRTEVDGFMDYLTNPKADMVKCDLEILGDPVFLGQDAWLPLPPPGSESEKVARYKGYRWDKNSGSFNLDRAEAFVELTIKFPTDINERKSVMDFQTNEEVMFNGLYKVNQVVSNFENGKFTQTLNLVRLDQQGKEINVAEQIKALTDYRDTKADYIQGITRIGREQLEALTKYVNDLGRDGA